jgi:hypothetical protein
MSDRELLELAAKAAGIKLCVWGSKGKENFANVSDAENHKLWNPLTDDGDALRLAVKIASLRKGAFFGVTISSMHDGQGFASAEFHSKDGSGSTHVGEDPYAATRRAIVRAAAEIGKTM